MTEKWRAELSKLQALEPPIAPWERPIALRPVPSVGGQGKRLLAIGVAFGIATLAFVGIWVGFHPLRTSEPKPSVYQPAGVPDLPGAQNQLSVRGIELSAITAMPGGSPPAISAAQAMSSARSYLANIDGFGDARLTATLVSYTDAYLPFTNLKVRPVTQASASPTPERLVGWLVLSSPVRVSVLDPSPGPGVTISPVNIAAFIDPSSGALAEVKTVFTGRSPDHDWPLRLTESRPPIRLSDEAVAASTSQYLSAANPLRTALGGDISHQRVMRAAVEYSNVLTVYCSLSPKRTRDYC